MLQIGTRKGLIMAGRAPDIEELEKLLNDGEGDDLLNAQAIKILERIKMEVKRAKPYGTMAGYTLKELAIQQEDFEKVLKQIAARRHKHVLDEFIRHVKTHKA